MLYPHINCDILTIPYCPLNKPVLLLEVRAKRSSNFCDMIQNIKITIRGKVHKVGFRYYVIQKARNLDLCGIVKYSKGHNIIIEVTGDDDTINELIGYCRLGSPGAGIEDLSISDNNIRHSNPFRIEFGTNDKDKNNKM